MLGVSKGLMGQRERWCKRLKWGLCGHGSRGWCKIGRERILLKKVFGLTEAECESQVKALTAELIKFEAFLSNIPGKLILKLCHACHHIVENNSCC